MPEIIASTYELLEKIGSGGGGNVYLAKHLRLEKKVVLKKDKRKITARPELLRREIDVLKNLSHTNIPQVYDYFTEGENVYTVMEYIEGESLDKPLKRGEIFSQPQVIKWGIQLLEALCYLHSPTHGNPPHAYMHSDIKPANIMRTLQNDICLIDFNIALAIGEKNVVGRSPGYGPPEYYGYDFSSAGNTATSTDETVLLNSDTETVTLSNVQQSSSGSPSIRMVIPDARSDIYSVGATLYHLLSGKRPAKDVRDVIPLSDEEFSHQIVKIISKAMNPNPDLRYQTAEEMLYDFTHLRENDPRVKKIKRNRKIVGLTGCVFLLIGISSAFIGLKRMQVTENWLKMAEYSRNALAKGDTVQAINDALLALPDKTGLLMPPALPEGQNALTEALGVYNLSDDFKAYKTIELPSEPLYMAIAPGGESAACIYKDNIAVFNTDTAEITATLPAESSALSEVEYLNEHIIIYAGDDGIRAYDIEKNQELWHGGPATAISISQDKSTVAAVYKHDTSAIIYDASSGKEKCKIDFEGKCQRITINDNFANPNENVFELNQDGSLLGISFSDGSLQVHNLLDQRESISILDKDSGYTHFEGGFYQQYFAFSATGSSDSLFAIIDPKEKKQMGVFELEGYCGVQTDENGIYLQSDNILVKMDPEDSAQTPLVTTSSNILHFAKSDTHTLIASDEGVSFFDKNAELITKYEKNYHSDFVQIEEDTALVGSLDSPLLCIMKYEAHSDSNVFTYDALYEHDEARISSDRQNIMLFSYKSFRIYRIGGELVAESELPDYGQIYDQQYRRNKGGDVLEVTYNDGTIYTYDAKDGALLDKKTGNQPDMTLYEEYDTDNLRIEAELHGTIKAYEKDSGKFVRELKEDAYLTYVTQAGNYIVAQYVTTDEDFYGVLMNEKCETLAYLPCLCDVDDDELFFDYPTGNVRKSKIYGLEELKELGKSELEREE